MLNFQPFQVIETKASIASKMAELERLQKRLKAINQENYRQKDRDGSEFWLDEISLIRILFAFQNVCALLTSFHFLLVRLYSLSRYAYCLLLLLLLLLFTYRRN